MATIPYSEPPDGIDPDLSLYLSEMFASINIALGQVDQVKKYGVMPNKTSVGKIYYFTQAISPDIRHAGFWGYVDTLGWVYLGSDLSVEASYGGLKQVADIPYPDITDVWQTVQFDTPTLNNPRKISQDVANNALIILDEGVYRLGFSFSVRHDEKNSGRALTFRLRNPGSGYVSDSISVGTGRNVDSTYFSLSMLVEALDTGIGTDIIVEVKADTSDLKEIYTSVLVTESAFDLNSVSGQERGLAF